MGNPGCEWIRSRLPLFAGAGEGLIDPEDDGGDLDVEDRRAIERHLAGCAGCRGRRADLAGAFEALAVAAGTVPAEPDAPSLWPALERRIAARAPRPVGDAPRAGHREPAAEPDAAPSWVALDDERPLQSAWLQDTLWEAAEAVGLGARPVRSEGAGSARFRGWRVAGMSLAASVLLLLVVVPAVWRLRASYEAKELANAVPVEPLAGPPAPTDLDPAAADSLEPEEGRVIDARQLAQAEPIEPPAEPAPAAARPTHAARAGASARSGYDLEHGTPMPPDDRDARPVY